MADEIVKAIRQYFVFQNGEGYGWEIWCKGGQLYRRKLKPKKDPMTSPSLLWRNEDGYSTESERTI